MHWSNTWAKNTHTFFSWDEIKFSSCFPWKRQQVRQKCSLSVLPSVPPVLECSQQWPCTMQLFICLWHRNSSGMYGSLFQVNSSISSVRGVFQWTYTSADVMTVPVRLCKALSRWPRTWAKAASLEMKKPCRGQDDCLCLCASVFLVTKAGHLGIRERTAEEISIFCLSLRCTVWIFFFSIFTIWCRSSSIHRKILDLLNYKCQIIVSRLHPLKYSAKANSLHINQ